MTIDEQKLQPCLLPTLQLLQKLMQTTGRRRAFPSCGRRCGTHQGRHRKAQARAARKGTLLAELELFKIITL